MKRKAMAITLTAAMLAGLTAVPTWAEDAAADEGKVLNIYDGYEFNRIRT